MRKRIVAGPSAAQSPSEEAWLVLAPLVQVEVTSEAPGSPIEAALESGGQAGSERRVGWQAASEGTQTVRLCFDAPMPLRRIWLQFHEPATARTQEFVLRWSSDGGQSYRELIRQQWTFSPAGAVSETEDYRVELDAVTTLELTIVPEISGTPARACLAEWRLA
jgi:hypothetical protein